MSRSRRNSRDDVGMNLFPFLAVLICTMGSLIMLLVVMVQQARVRAQDVPQPEVTALSTTTLDAQAVLEAERAQAEELARHKERQKLAAQKQEEIESLQWQASLLRPSYDETVKQLSDQRLALSHLEEHTRELSDKASAMQAEADLIAETTANESSVQSDQEQQLENAQKQLAAAQKQLDEKQDLLASQPVRYALVPYDGPSGTQRPPIYIECLPDRVVLQPENVTLIGEDFSEPIHHDNPLALALRAKREFMLKHGLISQTEPYPLLVVRPGSASSYAAARTAMKAWEAEFGYELVENELKLDYAAPDPRLVTLLQDVVIEARGRRRFMRQAMQRRPQRELLRPSLNGGFESVGGRGTQPTAGRGGSSQPFETNATDGTVDGFGAGSSARRTERGNTNRFDASHNGNTSTSANSPGHGGAFDAPTANGDGRSFGGFGDHSSSSSSSSADTAASSAEDRVAEQNGRGAQNGADAQKPDANGTSPVPGGNSTGDSAGGDGSGGDQSSGFGMTQSLAKSRGKNWALPNVEPSAVGIRRPISVVCDPNRLALIPEKGTRQQLQIFRHRGAITSVVDPFVNAVHARLEGWGIAGQGIYWKPVLQISVRNDADELYQQLRQLMDGSGFEVILAP